MPRLLRYIALVPAAGVGARMGTGSTPKQYLKLGDRTMLEHSIDALLTDGRIDRVFVVVAPDDSHWKELDIDAERVEFLPVGGTLRAETVRNGLVAIASRTADDDRVLVHDAARPCLAEDDLARLIDEIGEDDAGGLLALPLADTLKRGADRRVAFTLEREGLWCAQTPQLFRVGSLRAALTSLETLHELTDESSALERSGHSPRLVAGAASNLKITTADDLLIARAILAAQGRIS